MNSMTGFGRAEGQIGSSHLTVELKSVNHRYLDVRQRLPGFLSAIELAFSERIRKSFSRGSFELTVRHRIIGSQEDRLTGTQFVLDPVAAQTFHDGVQSLCKQLRRSDTPPLWAFLANNKILVPVEESQDIGKFTEPLMEILDKAMDQLEQTRRNEGEKLFAILSQGISELKQTATSIAKLASLQPPKIAENLKKKLEKWQLSPPVDGQRLEWEVAMYADRSDFTEEMDRLGCLSDDFSDLLQKEGPIGRKLDFLTQELHRELNTLGSKAALIEITQCVVSAKTQLEKLRQQVQNVE